MKIYICKICTKQFNKKSTYDYHISRLIPCIKINTNECCYCNKIYSNKSNLNKHMNICKKKTINDESLSQIDEIKKLFERKLAEHEKKFEEQQKDNQELKKKVEELSQKEIKNNSINVTENNITNNNITTNNTINIYSSGKEDLSILDKEDILKLCTAGTFYPIIAAEILHCNEKYPEFQNVLISNLRASTGLVKLNDKWVTKSHDELLTNMMKVDKKHISTLIKDLEVDKKLKVKLESTQDEIDTNECKEHHKDKIKRKLYDASKHVSSIAIYSS